MRTAKPGDFVYWNYSPGKVGKVIQDLGPEIKPALGGGTFASTFHILRVKQLADGQEVDVDARHLKNFNALIADHQRKLNTHLATLAKLQTL